MRNTALIAGVSGQDGAYLAKYLLGKGYTVIGTSRDSQSNSFSNLFKLGIFEQVKKASMSVGDFRSVLETITRYKPDEIYNFSGQSSVGVSFTDPVETVHSHAIGTLNLLEVVRYLGGGIKVYNASSGECFGDIAESGATENHAFRPKSPYAVAKAAAFWECANYRDAYGIYVCSGILFNHESPLRPERFVTRKIISAACRISLGSTENLILGNLNIRRDWGWAPEYVEAMWLMMQLSDPQDFVISTGRSYGLEDFVAQTFSALGLNWRRHVLIDDSLIRPADIYESKGDSSKAKKILGWSARNHMPEVVNNMISAELEFIKKSSK